MEKIKLQGVDITLQDPGEGTVQWIDYNDYELQLEAAWLSLADGEPPLNPRLIGEPGLGKTTLARRWPAHPARCLCVPMHYGYAP